MHKDNRCTVTVNVNWPSNKQAYEHTDMSLMGMTQDESEAYVVFQITVWVTSFSFPLQLPVCGDIADLLVPSAGDAGDLQFSWPVAVGRAHSWRGDGPLPQPDNSQEKGHTLFFSVFKKDSLSLI